TSFHDFIYNPTSQSFPYQYHSIISVVKLFRNHFQRIFMNYFSPSHSSAEESDRMRTKKPPKRFLDHICLTRSRSSARLASLKRSTVPTRYPVIRRIFSN